MITISLLSLSPETLRRMQDHEAATETGGRRWERFGALAALGACALAALVAVREAGVHL